MRAERAWLQLTWPRAVTEQYVLDALRSLNGLSTLRSAEAVVLEVEGTDDSISHRLGCVEERVESTIRQLRQAVPGLGLEAIDRHIVEVDRAWRLWLSTPRRPLLTTEMAAVTGALLAALASVERGERLLLQLWLGPVRRPARVPAAVRGEHHDSWIGSLARAPLGGPGSVDSEGRRALRDKQAVPGWRAVGRIAVRAAGVRRQRQLLGRVLAAARTAQGPGVELGARPTFTTPVRRAAVPWRWPLALNIEEVAGLAAWPIGELSELPVRRSPSRRVPPSRAIPGNGRVIGDSTYPGQERSLALSATDALRHLLVLGPTGTGKSTLLLNLIVHDLRQRRAVLVVDPKGDLVDDVLARVPAARTEDVVLIDAGRGDRIVGLNPLASGAATPEVAAEHLLAAFHQLYRDSWGPRLADILHAGLLTLALGDGVTLCHLPMLFTQPGFRRPLVARVRDDVALGSFWAWFDNLDDSARATVLAPLQNKLRAVVLRPQLRVILGQARPAFDMADLFRRRRIVLVNLGKAELGPEAANLLGALVLGQLWQATLARRVVPPERRHPVICYLDEWQDYAALPTDIGDALVQARSHGVGLVLANQHLAQLAPTLKSAVLANAQSRVVFRTGYDDAAALARGGHLEPDDFAELPAFEAYAQLVADGTVQPYASIRTMPPVPPTRDPAELAAHSRDLYGASRRDVEAALRQAFTGASGETGMPIGSRRRSSDGGDR